MSRKTTSAGPNAFVSEAYNLNTSRDVVNFYSKWAEDYDRQMLDELGYTSPNTIAQMLHRFAADRQSQVFDVGCGTGLTSKLLSELGYTKIDGLDLSPEMIEVARQRGIYRKLVVADITVPLAIEDNYYDAVISSGTFTHGHVGPEPLDELFRILRPGGILACTVHHDLWTTRGFANKFEELINQGLVSCLSKHEDKYYAGGALEGWFCIYQKEKE